MSADLLHLPKTTPAPAATEGVVPASAVDMTETAGRFGQALAAAQKDDKMSVGGAQSDKTQTDPAEADRTGVANDLSAELLAVLLGQQTPQPVVDTGAQTAEGEAGALLAVDAQMTDTLTRDVLTTDALAVKAMAQMPVAATAATPLTALAPELSANLLGEAGGETDETSPEDAFADALDALAGKGEDPKAAPEAKTDSRRTSVEEALQSLSSAMNTSGDSATSQASSQASAQTSAAQTQILAQMQAQVAPPTDSGVRFAPTPPTAQQTAQTYSMSPQMAENMAALSAQITRRLGNKSTSFDMELRPTDMGKVDVKLEIGHDGKLTAHLRFDSPVAESEFKGRQDDLRRQLEQAGFQMDDASLNFASGDQGRGRQYSEAEPSDYAAPVAEPETVPEAAASADAHTLIDAQLMAAASADPTLYAQMSAGGYGQTRTLSLSVLV